MNRPSCSQPLAGDATFCGHRWASLAPERECAGCGRSNAATGHDKKAPGIPYGLGGLRTGKRGLSNYASVATKSLSRRNLGSITLRQSSP